jgi:lysophospholipase L1-like esterase
MKIIIKNLSLLLFGIILSLFLAEMLLSLSGWIYYGVRINKKSEAKVNKNTIKILCLGDSFTFGMGADRNYTFPEQLEKKLNSDSADKKRYTVFNRGYPGNTSAKLLNSLEEDLRKFKPNIILVLIGVNDSSCIEETNYFELGSSCGSIASRFNAWLNNTKLCKLFKKAKQSFEIKQWEKKLNVMYGTNRFFESLRLSNPHHSKIDPVKLQRANAQYQLVQQEYFNIRDVKIDLALSGLQEAIRIMPEHKDSRICLAQLFIHTNKLDLAIDQLGESMRINPYDPEIWNKLWLIYFRQGKFNLAEDTLKIYLYLDPSAIPKYLMFLKHGFPDPEDQRGFDNLLRKNLKKIVDIAKRNQTQVILQEYPDKDERLDLIVLAVAQKNNIFLVEHSSIFEALKMKDGYRYDDYFLEDGHCNNRGYSVMADNIYKVLRNLPENSH